MKKKLVILVLLIISIDVNAQTLQDWGRKQAITINSTYVEGASNLTDFPFLVTLDHLDPEIVDGGANSALNGGGDVRFSSDTSGNNQLAIEVVQFVTSSTLADRKCQIWVKIPSLSATSDTTIYIWYNKSGETQPIATDTYGSQAVWSNNYVSIWHMEEDPSGTSPQVLDSGLGLNNGITGGSMQSNDLVSSKIGNGLDLNGTDQFVNVGNSSSLNLTSNLTISGWFNPTIYGDMYLFAKRNETVVEGYNILLLYPNDFGVYDTTAHWNSDATWEYTTNQWNYAVVKFNISGTGYTGFLNGEFGSQKTIPVFPDGLAQNLYLGARSNGIGLPFSGSIDEFRVSNIERSNDWIATEYNNQNSPSTFATAGTPDTASGSGVTGYWSLNNQDVYYNIGNVGIGTTTPDEKLAVKGSIHSEEVKVDLSVPAPDYVFETDYDLTPLGKLQEYIKTYKHLPNIPSAKDMEANGIELGIMNMKLLEKIEELTLYVLEQQKRIDVQSITIQKIQEELKN